MPEIVAICQPNFLPWMGYLEMADRADIFVMLDDAQFVRREWMNRNRVPDGKGGTNWLTVPVAAHHQKTALTDIDISYAENWPSRMIATIRHLYGKTPHFDRYFNDWAALFERQWQKLVDLNIATISLFANQLGIECNLERASEIGATGTKDDRLAAICERLGAQVYLANNGSKSYIDPAKFTGSGIGFVFQDFQHPEYTQGGQPFVSHLSALDVLFHHGPQAREIVLSGRPRDWRADILSPDTQQQTLE